MVKHRHGMITDVLVWLVSSASWKIRPRNETKNAPKAQAQTDLKRKTEKAKPAGRIAKTSMSNQSRSIYVADFIFLRSFFFDMSGLTSLKSSRNPPLRNRTIDPLKANSSTYNCFAWALPRILLPRHARLSLLQLLSLPLTKRHPYFVIFIWSYTGMSICCFEIDIEARVWSWSHRKL